MTTPTQRIADAFGLIMSVDKAKLAADPKQSINVHANIPVREGAFAPAKKEEKK